MEWTYRFVAGHWMGEIQKAAFALLAAAAAAVVLGG